MPHSSKTLSHVAKDQENLMHNYKIYNAIEYVRINNLNRIVTNPKDAKIGIIASGKSYLDVVEALDMLQDKIKEQSYESSCSMAIRAFYFERICNWNNCCF